MPKPANCSNSTPCAPAFAENSPTSTPPACKNSIAPCVRPGWIRYAFPPKNLSRPPCKDFSTTAAEGGGDDHSFSRPQSATRGGALIDLFSAAFLRLLYLQFRPCPAASHIATSARRNQSYILGTARMVSHNRGIRQCAHNRSTAGPVDAPETKPARTAGSSGAAAFSGFAGAFRRRRVDNGSVAHFSPLC